MQCYRSFVLIGAVTFGLALLAPSELLSVVKWLGVGYLAFLIIMLMRSKGTLEDSFAWPQKADQAPRALSF